jgi:hypothetical protein
MLDTTQAIADLTGDYVIDPAHSRIGFVARHAIVAKVRGSFTEFDGRVHLDEQNPGQSTAQIVIKVHSIDTGNRTRRLTHPFLNYRRQPRQPVGPTDLAALHTDRLIGRQNGKGQHAQT